MKPRLAGTEGTTHGAGPDVPYHPLADGRLATEGTVLAPPQPKRRRDIRGPRPTLRRALIAGTGAYLPDRVLSNQDLEKMVATSDAWIVERTGICERRVAAAGQTTSQLALPACRQACETAGINPAELDLIIVATATPDMLFPSTACLLQAALGATRAGAFDLSAACSGFLYALATGAQFVQSGASEKALIVGAETLSTIVDYTDRTTCILFGDGAGAVVLRPNEEGRGLLFHRLAADGTRGEMISLPAGGSKMPATAETVAKRMHYMKLHGREVFKFAVTTMVDLVEEALLECDLKVGDLALIIPHQVNARIIDAAMKKLSLPKEKVYVNIDRYGNTSAASIPIALAEASRAGRVKPGDYVLLVAFGAGLTFASSVIRM